MTYSRKDDEVTVVMTTDDYALLLAILGFASMFGTKRVVEDTNQFIENINRTNPDILLYLRKGQRWM